MSDSAKQNVVNLDDYSQLRRGPGGGAQTQALRAVHDFAANRIKQQIGQLMEKVDDALYERAEMAESKALQTFYFEAMRELRIVRGDVANYFLEAFSAGFDQGIPRDHDDHAEPGGGSGPGGQPGLLGTGGVSEQLAISDMISKVRENCTRSLPALDTRIGFLLDDPELEHWENPLGPEAVCAAFRAALHRVETGTDIRLIILRLFDQNVIPIVDELYREANQRLIRLGVLPDASDLATRSAPQPSAPGAPGAALPAGNSARGTPGHGSGPAEGADFSRATAVSASLTALTSLQHGGIKAANDQGAGVSVDPGALDSGQVNILQAMKGSAVIRNLGEAGSMTIDMVAMLFDYILDDPNVPDGMRALIGRLQIPVLKVALLEREFFTRKSHAARQLLNLLAATAVGWDAQHGSEDPVYRKVEAVVQTILDRFDDDTGLFQTLLEDLEAFLHTEEERAEVRAERSARVMEGEERLEIAKSTTLDEIEPRVSDAVSVDFVRTFVTTHWKNLLFVICARQGKESDDWKQAVATMDDLIWSVKPKQTVEDRRRLAAIQPTLLGNLRMGMERLSIPATERDDFIARLVHAHGRAVVNEVQEEIEGPVSTPIDPEPDATDNQRPAPESRRRTRGPRSRRANKTRSAPQFDAYVEQVRMLSAGTWLEINGIDGKATRVKLSWVSPITGTYLFTDRQGLKAGNYTLQDLAQLLRTGRARVVSSRPLMDRAVDSVFKHYDD
jgi:hypothetical protein